MSSKIEPKLKKTLLSNTRIYWSVIFIILATIFVFTPALQNGFYYDDGFSFLYNNHITTLSSIKYLFTPDYFRISNFASFRPLVTFFYILEYQFFKLNPRPYHIINIIIHLVNIGLIFYLVNLISKNRKLSFLTVFIFAIHPVQAEAVNGISFSGDLLVTFFVCLSTIGFIKYLEQTKTSYFALSLVSFLMALFCKGQALMIPVFFLFYVFLFSTSKKNKGILASFFIITLLYSWIRFVIFRFNHSYSYIHDDFIKRLFFAGEVFFKYLIIILNPKSIKLLYPISYQIGCQECVHIFSVITLLTTGLILIIKKKTRETAFFSAWIIVFITPALGIFYPLYAKMANRLLYLPFIGFSFLGACFILYGAKVLSLKWRKGSQYKTSEPALNQDSRRINPGNIIMSLFAGIFFLASTGFIHKDLNFRKNDAAFFKEVVSQYPQQDSYKLELAIALYNDNPSHNIPEIKTLLDESRQSQRNEFLFNLLSGLVCSLEQKYPQALEYLKKAEAKKTNFYYQNNALYFALGHCYCNLKKIDLAEEYYLKTLKADPNHLKAINSLGILYASIGKYGIAKEWLRKGLNIDPHNTNISHNLKLIQKKQKSLPQTN